MSLSDLQVKYLEKEMNHAFDQEFFEKVTNIFLDKQIFVPANYEEDTREVLREKINTKMISVVKEINKIKPFSEVVNNFQHFITMCAPLLLYNDNLTTKFAVNLQLYHKSVVYLGTDQHKNFARNCEEFIDIGCFALTELSHGSNARGIETTATYDKASKEFIINTPRQEDMKFWIGGAAKSAHIAVVFAQLIVEGKKYGPHAFVVPIRDRQHHLPLPGIILGDCGKKIGKEGVDNGFIIFNHVRIPRENLLNRFSDVTEDG